MLLLYLPQITETNTLYVIYIPLCFYFIGTGSWRLFRGFSIYIPLCFYFIPAQSASLYSLPNLHSTMLLLYKGFGIFSYDFIRHLHSTMLLLYGDTGVVCKIDHFIYIPLCFYFILFFLLACGGWNKFTFHYASTLLLYSWLIKQSNQNLHSTMLLLYSEYIRLKYILF